MLSKIDYLNTCFPNTQTFLKEVKDDTETMLSPTTASGAITGTPTSQTVYHHHTYTDANPFYYSRCTPSSNNKDKSKKDGSSLLIAVPVALAATGTLYFVAQDHGNLSRANTQIENLKNKRIDIQREMDDAKAEDPAAAAPLEDSVNSVFQKQMKLLNTTRSSAATGLQLKAVLLGSLTALCLGFLSQDNIILSSNHPLVQWLGLGGGIGTAGAGLALLYRAGFNSDDTTLQKQAKDLQHSAKIATQSLNGFANRQLELS